MIQSMTSSLSMLIPYLRSIESEYSVDEKAHAYISNL